MSRVSDALYVNVLNSHSFSHRILNLIIVLRKFVLNEYDIICYKSTIYTDVDIARVCAGDSRAKNATYLYFVL